MNLVETQVSQLARALSDTVHVAAAGYLDLATLDLYQTDIDVRPNVPLATFVSAVATYSGYVQGAIVWQLPSVADDGTVEVIGTVTAFRPTSSTIQNTIYGCYITNLAASGLLFAGRFDAAPLGMNGVHDVILVTVRYRPATNSIVATVS